MKYQLTSLTAMAELPYDEIIDVRSPSEFAEDHIPGAINLSVLSDAERAQVGTVYVQQDRFLARKIGARMRELYQTDPVIDRTTRDADAAEPLADLAARAAEQVEQRLARYQPFETDPAIDAEMRRLVLDGMEAQDTLPEVPPPPEPKAPEPAPGRRGRRSRRRRG